MEMTNDIRNISVWRILLYKDPSFNVVYAAKRFHSGRSKCQYDCPKSASQRTKLVHGRSESKIIKYHARIMVMPSMTFTHGPQASLIY